MKQFLSLLFTCFSLSIISQTDAKIYDIIDTISDESSAKDIETLANFRFFPEPVRPFNNLDFADIRIMEAHENHIQQHQDVYTENNIDYGDVLDYTKKPTAINEINMVNLASAQVQPKNVSFGGIIEVSAKLKWDKVDDFESVTVFPNQIIKN